MRKSLTTGYVLAAFVSALALSSVGSYHGPTLPPDPWAGFAVLQSPAIALESADPGHGPTLPPDPWAGFA